MTDSDQIAITIPSFKRRVGAFLPLTDAVRDLLHFVLTTRPLAFLARASRSLDPQSPSYRDDNGAVLLLSIGAAKEAGDKFAEAERRGWFAPLLAQVPKDKFPEIHSLHASLCAYCANKPSNSLLSRITPIRDFVSFHVNRGRLTTACTQLTDTVQEFHPISPTDGIVDPFLGILSAQIVETATGKTSDELQFLVEEVPNLVAALANFGEQIYNLLLVERLSLEKNDSPAG